MGDLLKLIWYTVSGLLRSRAALQTEILVVCTENLIRVDDVTEWLKLAE
jgi:hypothetical protein